MRRHFSILPMLLLLAACGGGEPPASPAEQFARASFPRGGISDVIKIEAHDALPLRTAELVAPDGTATAASSLEAARAPHVSGGAEALKSPWRNAMFNESNVALPNGPPDSAYRSETQLLLIVSSADIPLPDPVVYHRDWANYRIRLGFGAAGGQLETREIAAPEPLPPGNP